MVEVCVCACACMQACMFCTSIFPLRSPIEQLCLWELFWGNWMSQGRGKPAAGSWRPLALLSIIHQPLCLRFVVRSWIQKWMWGPTEVNAGRDEVVVFNQSQIEQSLYPPLWLRGELAFNIPGHVSWDRLHLTTKKHWKLRSNSRMFSIRESNMPLG